MSWLLGQAARDERPSGAESGALRQVFFFLSQRTNTFGGSLIKGYMYQRTKNVYGTLERNLVDPSYTVHSLLMLSVKMGYLRRCVTFWSGLP